MHVAFDQYHHLFTGKSLNASGATRPLRDVPVTIVLGRRIDVVRSGITIDDADLLAGPNTQNMGAVQTALLIQRDRSRGRADR